MPAMTFYRHGCTASIPNMSGNPNPPKRGKVTGWSAGAARRNTNFLRSVDERKLDGFGLAVTLTLKDCPPSSKAWSNLIRAWIERQHRAGMKRLHWVMEFQKRGVPHLHVAVWYHHQLPGEDAIKAVTRLLNRQSDVVEDWVDLAEAYGASRKAQFWRLIEGPVGWFQYMSKHCSRSRKHYQRQRDSLPDEWQSTGRVWGHRGEWETIEPEKLHIDRQTFWRLRRLVKKARLAEARTSLPLNAKQFGYLRRILKCCDRKASETRPISEWMPIHRQHDLLEAATPNTTYNPDTFRPEPLEHVEEVAADELPY